MVKVDIKKVIQLTLVKINFKTKTIKKLYKEI